MREETASIIQAVGVHQPHHGDALANDRRMTCRWFASALVALAACEKLAASPDPPPEANAQCSRDEDCTLAPSALTCCGECPPAPPFEAAPVWEVDARYIENENRCLAPEISCGDESREGDASREQEVIDCPQIPAGCTARAACTSGRCTAVTSGCGIPTS